MWFYFLTILNGYKYKQRDERWDYSSESSRPSQVEGSKQESYFSYIIFLQMDLFTIFILYIYSNTTLNMEESKERAYNTCTSIHYEPIAKKSTVRQLCWDVWDEYFDYDWRNL